MKKLVSCAVAVALSGVAIAGMTASADAKGCIKGAVVGGVAGHAAGHHGMLGAAAGCLVGHHMANKHQQESQTPDGTSPTTQK